MASVTYDHVTKKFGEMVAVDNLDIKVDDQEFLVTNLKVEVADPKGRKTIALGDIFKLDHTISPSYSMAAASLSRMLF